jgi:serine/threonine protein phosphatase PrpC
MNISILNEAMPVPGRLNEDTCGIYSSGATDWLFVADGAGQRVHTQQTADLFAGFGEHTTAGRFAAGLVQQTFEIFAPHYDPGELLLQANRDLHGKLCGLYGSLSAAALRQHEPALIPYLDEDPRLLRLALPVCVATAVQLDRHTGRLRCAHAGDTALYLFHQDGRVTQPTSARISSHDDEALRLAVQMQRERGLAHLADALTLPEVAEANRRNGLYHNYVDDHGQPDLNVGFGVINGLPVLEAYLYRFELPLTDVTGVLVCSDGFPWPAPLDESAEARQARLNAMRARIERDGLRGYYAALRACEQADSDRDQYPRFKVHDDCTAVYVALD